MKPSERVMRRARVLCDILELALDQIFYETPFGLEAGTPRAGRAVHELSQDQSERHSQTPHLCAPLRSHSVLTPRMSLLEEDSLLDLRLGRHARHRAVHLDRERAGGGCPLHRLAHRLALAVPVRKARAAASKFSPSILKSTVISPYRAAAKEPR